MRLSSSPTCSVALDDSTLEARSLTPSPPPQSAALQARGFDEALKATRMSAGDLGISCRIGHVAQGADDAETSVLTHSTDSRARARMRRADAPRMPCGRRELRKCSARATRYGTAGQLVGVIELPATSAASRPMMRCGCDGRPWPAVGPADPTAQARRGGSREIRKTGPFKVLPLSKLHPAGNRWLSVCNRVRH